MRIKGAHGDYFSMACHHGKMYALGKPVGTSTVTIKQQSRLVENTEMLPSHRQGNFQVVPLHCEVGKHLYILQLKYKCVPFKHNSYKSQRNKIHNSVLICLF